MTTFSAQITASADDAFEEGGAMTLDGTVVRLNNNDENGGFRWLTLTGVKGSTINTATVTIDISNATNDDPDVIIRGDTANAPATFTTTASDISNRSTTTANVAWNATGVGSGSAVSPDISTVVQEIADNGSWDENLVIIFFGQSTNSVQYKTWDQSAAVSGQIDIDYTEAAAGQPTTLRATTVPGMRQWQSRY